MLRSRRHAFGFVTALALSFGAARDLPALSATAQEKGAPPAPQQQEPAKTREVVPAAPQEAPARAKKGDRGARAAKEAPIAAPAPLATTPIGAPDPKLLRNIAKQMVTMERIHRERQARMDRLIEVFSETKATDKIKEVEALRTKENTRYLAAMEGYKKSIGPEIYTKICALMNGQPAGSNSGAGATRGGR